MFGYMRKEVFRHICRIAGFDASRSHVRHLRALNPSFEYRQASAVSSLADTCGLSEEKPLKPSKLVKIKGKTNSDSVFKLFLSYGFSEIEIKQLISKRPSLVVAKPEKTLKPKLEYIKSLGFSNRDLPKIIRSNVLLLVRGLKNGIVPTFDFLREFVETNENVIRVFQKSPRAIYGNVEKAMKPNVAYLAAIGVPRENIVKLMMLRPQALTWNETLFKKIVDEVQRLGFDPTKGSFNLAIRTFSCLSQDYWNKKKEMFISFGWSESEFAQAFRLQPMLMMTSEMKIRKIAKFFVEKLGIKPSSIAKYPNVFLLSLEGRIIPRCSVLNVLMSKNLVDEDAYMLSEDSPRKIANLVWILIDSKVDFEKKFVIPYGEEVPHVMKAYNGEIDFEGFCKSSC